MHLKWSCAGHLDAEIADGERFRPYGGLEWDKEIRAVQQCVGLTISSKLGTSWMRDAQIRE